MLRLDNQQLKLPRCPHCKISAPLLQSVWGCKTANSDGQDVRDWRAYQCSRCGGVVLCAASSSDTCHIVTAQYPRSEALDHSAIPSRALEYLNQAIESIHSPAASVVVAASAVDAMLKAKGYQDGNLYSRINQAVNDHLITKEMGEWAHEVRLDANEQRHADDNAPLPTGLDAQRVIDFAKALAQFLFVLPAMVDKGRHPATPTKASPAPLAKPNSPPSLAGS